LSQLIQSWNDTGTKRYHLLDKLFEFAIYIALQVAASGLLLAGVLVFLPL
jgi:hypothetical protein